MTRSLGRATAAAAVLFCMMGAPEYRGQAQTAAATRGASPIVGIDGIVYGVETLEKSVEFYQKVLGFELTGTVPDAPLFDIHVQALTNHGGVLARRATLRIPHSPISIQLFEGTNGQPGTRSSLRQATARPSDPGGAVLTVQVPSLAATVANIESSHQGDVISMGGKPSGNRVVVRNRDGVVTEIVQSDGPGAPGRSEADVASIALTAGSNVASKMQFYRDVLGFDLKTGEWEGGKDVMPPLGADVGMIRRSAGYVPGTKIRFEIDEYSGLPQKRAYYYYNSIPGAVSIQLAVRDIDQMVKALRAAQVRIVTTGQQAVPLDHSRTVLIRDPDGVFIQLMEHAQNK